MPGNTDGATGGQGVTQGGVVGAGDLLDGPVDLRRAESAAHGEDR